MSELGQGSRALINAARQAERLSANDKARIRSQINQRMATGVALGSVFTASSAAAKVGLWLPTAAKILAIAVVSTGVGYVSLQGVVPHRTTANRTAQIATTERAPTHAASKPDNVGPATSASAASVEPSESMAARFRSVPPNPPAAPVGAPPLASKGGGVALPKPIRGVVTGRTMGALQSPDVSSAATDGESRSAPAMDDGLARQVAAIRESRAATRRGDPQAALAALERASTEGKQGPLEQEFILAHISALCLQGNHDAARELANDFLSRFAQSPLSRRVRATCAFDLPAQP